MRYRDDSPDDPANPFGGRGEPRGHRGRGRGEHLRPDFGRPDHGAEEHGRPEHPGEHPPRGPREGGRRMGPGGRSRGRAQRGDVRTAILLVLADQPMHGYQIMQTIAERSGGAWRPSPGAIYPTIALLEDEGLVTTTEEGGRRLATLTADGTSYLAERSARLGDPFADFASAVAGADLRGPVHELQAAARQIAASGDPSQLEAAARVLAQARRSLYLILAGEPEPTDEA